MKKLMVVFLMFSFFSTPLFAEITPDYGQYDPRVRVVDYNKGDVTKIVTYFGVSTHIEFSESEVILDIAPGDPNQWEIIPRTSNLFIRPIGDFPDTNLTIITNKRTYQFALFVAERSKKDKTAWQNANLIFSLVFRYKEEELDLAKEEINKQKVKDALKKKSVEYSNIDYWLSGSEEISPTKAKDNGRFIELTFSNNRDMPAIYSVNEDGVESLINTHVEGNKIIIQRMIPFIRLRIGDYVACIINRSFNFNEGKDNATGTVSTKVKRTIKGGEE